MGFFIAVVGAGAATPAPTRNPASTAPPPGIEGFAEEATIAWLEATGEPADQTSTLYVERPDVPVGATSSVVRRTSVLGARRISDGYWAVTVAAVIDERDRDRATVATSALYAEVGIQVGPSGGMAATGTPAVVAAPAPLQAPARPAGPTPGIASANDPVVATVQGFLNALLTGSGDVSRYLAPSVEINAVSPAPVSKVIVDRLAIAEIEGGARARVLAVATSPAGGRRSLGYEIGIRERSGRWEVTSVSGAPALTGHDRAAPPAGPATASSPPAPSTTAPSGGEPAESSTTSFASEPGA